MATKIDDTWKIVFDGNGQILCDLSQYDFPDDMLFDCSTNEAHSVSYQDIINYIDQNMTEIMRGYSTISPANGKWFADG